MLDRFSIGQVEARSSIVVEIVCLVDLWNTLYPIVNAVIGLYNPRSSQDSRLFYCRIGRVFG